MLKAVSAHTKNHDVTIKQRNKQTNKQTNKEIERKQYPAPGTYRGRGNKPTNYFWLNFLVGN